jgi:hypothetical protein
MCHRRSVEWIDRIHSTNLDSSIQRLINNRNTICEYPEPIEESGLDKLLGKRPAMSKENSIKLDQLFNDALKVLEEELKSTDPERRLRAAAELLKLKNS